MKKIPYATIIVCLAILAGLVASQVYLGDETVRIALQRLGMAITATAVTVGAIFLAVKYDSDRDAL